MQLPDFDLKDLTLSQGLAVFLVLFWCAYFWTLRKPIQTWLRASASASIVSAEQMPKIRASLDHLLTSVDTLTLAIRDTLVPRMARMEEDIERLLARSGGRDADE